MYCSCPYAAGGNNCKHMAAVLYEWTADIMDEDEPELQGLKVGLGGCTVKVHKGKGEMREGEDGG